MGGDNRSHRKLRRSRCAPVIQALERRELLSFQAIHDAGEARLVYDSEHRFQGPLAVGSLIYFLGHDDQHGDELWTSDGTKAGTHLLKDITPGPDESYVQTLTEWNGDVYFTVDTSTDHTLWRSDGTAVGTVQLQDFAGPFAAAPTEFTAVGGTLYFLVDQDQLWKTDGTAQGTAAVDLPGTENRAASLANFNGQLWFIRFTTDPDDPFDEVSPSLYETDGTTIGTHDIFDYTYGATHLDEFPQKLTVAGNRLYFSVPTFYGDDLGTLWSSAGTTNTTAALILPKVSGNNDPFTTLNYWSVNDRLVFFIDKTLWSTDGTNGGTVAIWTYAGNNLQLDGTVYSSAGGETLYFQANSYGLVDFLKTDGTAAGTKKLSQKKFDTDSPDIHFVTAAAGNIYYSGLRVLIGGKGTLKGLANLGDECTAIGDQVYGIGTGIHTILPSLVKVDPNHGSIYGYVFADADMDGDVNNGESGVIGTAIYVDLNRDGTLDSNEPKRVIGSDPEFHFDSLPPGQIQVRVIYPKGFTPTTAAIAVLNLTTDEIPDALMFGAMARGNTAAIGGTVFRDVDKDRHRGDSESLLEGTKIWVDENDNGKLDPMEPSAVSDASGKYKLTGLAGGVHVIHITPTTNYSLADYVNLNEPPFVPGQTTRYDVPENQYHSISGYVFDDLSLDGVRQDGEDVVAAQPVQIKFGTTKLKSSMIVTTDSTGHFQAYLPEERKFTIVIPSSSRRGTTTVPKTATVEGGSSTFDIGSTTTSVLQGRFYADNDIDHKFDHQEPGLSGWQVYIDENQNGQFDDGERNATTDAHGVFSLGVLEPGTYRVHALATGDYVAIESNIVDLKLASGKEVNLSFGFAQPATVSGVAFNDKNLDATKSPAEPVLAGITVFCDQNFNGHLDASEPNDVTDSKGRYTLEILGTGGRQIRALPGDGLRMGDVGDVTLGEQTICNVPLNNLGTIYVRVFGDTNRNGKLDAGEKYSEDLGYRVDFWLDQDLDSYFEYDEIALYQNYVDGFTDLEKYTYDVRIALPKSLICTTPKKGYIPVSLGKGEVRTVDFGVASKK